MKPIDIATPEEILETELVIIQAAGLKVKHIGYQKLMDVGFHLYDVLEPKLPGYTYGESMGYPTLSLDGMRELGLLKGKI